MVIQLQPQLTHLECDLPYMIPKGEQDHLRKSDFYELLFVVKGTCGLVLEGRKEQLRISENQWKMLAPGRSYSIESVAVEPTLMGRIAFSMEEVKESLGAEIDERCADSRVCLGGIDYLMDFVKESIKEEKECKRFYREKCQLALMQLLLQVIRGFGEVIVGRSVGSMNVRKQRKNPTGLLVENAAVYLEENCDKSTALKNVTQFCRMSHEHFSRQFKLKYGVGPKRYQLVCRIEKAKKMLVETDETNLNIALECGFYDEAHFSKSFKKLVGVYPRYYGLS